MSPTSGSYSRTSRGRELTCSWQRLRQDNDGNVLVRFECGPAMRAIWMDAAVSDQTLRELAQLVLSAFVLGRHARTREFVALLEDDGR